MSSDQHQFQYVTSLDLRHWLYTQHTIVGRSNGKIAEFFDFDSPLDVMPHLASQGFSIQPVDASPLSSDDKLAELLYVSLAQDDEIQHPVSIDRDGMKDDQTDHRRSRMP